ncbi:MAG: fibronectin type III domain-containing protein, partial [Nitrospirae bacterium]
MSHRRSVHFCLTISFVTALFFVPCLAPFAFGAGSATLTWDPNTESDLAGYNVYQGTSSGIYGPPINVGNTTTYTVTGLQDGQQYFFAVTAYDTSGNESGPSNEVSKTIAPPPPDTLAPSVTLTSPADGTTLSGITTLSATATDNIAVSKVQFQLDGTIIAGSDDTTAPYTFSWNTNGTTNGVHTLSAIAHDAAGNTTTSTAVTVTVDNSSSGSLLITNLTAASGAAYEVVDQGLVPGALAYIDRSYTYTTIPASMQGVTYIKTANNDKSRIDPTFLSFDVNQPVTVYVAVDRRISNIWNAADPSTWTIAWLQSFADTGLECATNDTTFHVYAKDFPAGTVVLGGNEKGMSMYTVAVVPGGNAPPLDTTAPTTPTDLAATATSASQIDLTWTAATDDVGVTGYTLYRDGAKLATVSTTSYSDTGLTANTTYAYTVSALDAAGNESAQSAAVSATTLQATDTTPPTLAVTSPTSGTTWSTTSSTISLAGTAADDVGVTVVTWHTDQGVNGNASGTTTWTVSNLSLHSGTNTITVAAWDGAGNSSTHTLTITLTPLDTTPPTLTLTSPTTSTTWSTTTSPLAISGTATDDVGVTQITWSNDRGGSGTASGTTSWTVGSIALLSGTNVLTVTAQDAAGNTTTRTLTVTFTPPDTTPPTVTLTSPSDGATVSGTITLTATAVDNVDVAGVQFQVDGANVGPEDTTNAYAVSFDTTALADGPHTVTAIAR